MRRHFFRGSHRTWWLKQRDARKRTKLAKEAGRRRNRNATAWHRSPKRVHTAVLKVPVHLVAEREEQRAKLRQVIDSAFEILMRGNSRVRFDFSSVAKIFPGGMLLFLAHLELLQLSFPGRVLVRVPPGSIVSQLLQHFGLAEKLGLPPTTVSPSHESVVHWRYLTGTRADGPKITELLNSYRNTVNAEIPEGLYDVLAEAFTNVRQHAFPQGDKTFEDLKRWWLFSRYVAPSGKTAGSLYIGVYDIGVGIQRSMRAKLTSGEIVFDIADEVMLAFNAGKNRILEKLLLSRAVDHERSSTGLGNRGLGLPEMKAFVLQTQSGRLYILSGRAQYTCFASQGEGFVSGCETSFPGTLILWSIPVHQKAGV